MIGRFDDRKDCCQPKIDVNHKNRLSGATECGILISVLVGPRPWHRWLDRPRTPNSPSAASRSWYRSRPASSNDVVARLLVDGYPNFGASPWSSTIAAAAEAISEPRRVAVHRPMATLACCWQRRGHWWSINRCIPSYRSIRNGISRRSRLIASVPIVLAVNPDVKATTVSELIALAKASPGKLNFGSSGHRFDQSSCRRIAEGAGRHRHRSYPLSRRGASDERSDRRRRCR